MMSAAHLRRIPGLVYVSRDPVTDPPTDVAIAQDEPWAVESVRAAGYAHVVTLADIENTAGFADRTSRTPLCVCFTHSFGKCAGRANCDPSTCHQIHIRRPVLAALRATYTHGRRTFFSRTVKAHLSSALRAEASRALGRDLAMHYLEFPASEVLPTAGLAAYEEGYRGWLTNDESPRDAAGRVAPFASPATHLCHTFARTGGCGFGKGCAMIHVGLRHAQTRDPTIAQALLRMDPSVPVAAANVGRWASMVAAMAPRPMPMAAMCLATPPPQYSRPPSPPPPFQQLDYSRLPAAMVTLPTTAAAAAAAVLPASDVANLERLLAQVKCVEDDAASSSNGISPCAAASAAEHEYPLANSNIFY